MIDMGISRVEDRDITNEDTALASIEGDSKQVSEKIADQSDISRPSPEREILQRWNEPRVNLYRYLAVLYSFVVLGMNDGVYGALLPYLEVYYNINYTVVSLVFLAPFVGYTLAALLNNKIHMTLGQRGITIIAPLCKIASYVVSSVHPPYPVLPIIFMLAGFGCGLEDGAFNAWIGNFAAANESLGILHGCYGIGATIAPLISTAMITKANLPWYTFYYLMASLAFVELIVLMITFREATGAVYREANSRTHSVGGRSNTKEALFNPITWICAFFLLSYVGVEVSLGGWIVTFMLRVRDGEPFASGMVATGFWLGITFGRVTLGFVTGAIGEKLAITTYVLIALGLELCFWLIPSFVASAIFVAFLGFFLGPLFPAAIVVATKLLPTRLHVSAIGFAAAFGGGGAAILPFAVGAIAQKKGVKVLQPIVLAFLAILLGLWLSLPGGLKKVGLEEVQRQREEEGKNVELGLGAKKLMKRVKRSFKSESA